MTQMKSKHYILFFLSETGKDKNTEHIQTLGRGQRENPEGIVLCVTASSLIRIKAALSRLCLLLLNCTARAYSYQTIMKSGVKLWFPKKQFCIYSHEVTGGSVNQSDSLM